MPATGTREEQIPHYKKDNHHILIIFAKNYKKIPLKAIILPEKTNCINFILLLV
jgi:hypothetical protein